MGAITSSLIMTKCAVVLFYMRNKTNEGGQKKSILEKNWTFVEQFGQISGKDNEGDEIKKLWITF